MHRSPRKRSIRIAAFPVLFAFLLSVPVAPSTAQEAAEKPKPTVEGLTADTMPRDIETASFYELFTWCQSLGLETGGGRKDLQARLRAHYGLETAAAAAAGKESGGKPGKKITVKSARNSEYFTEKETDEKYVRLTGDVHVEVKDEDSGSNHIILSQVLTYNMTRNMVTAHGDVEYTLDKGSSKEVFRGESLTFNLDTWEGVFYDGETSQSRKVSDKDVVFHFNGDVTSRLANDTIIMEDGRFTSCELTADPHWSVDAWRIWLLAPGEWSILSGVLNVGRVPLFYLPFFFLPGDEILFNPTIGFTAREGAHLQTTTYLLGRKKDQDSSLSFLKVTETSDNQYKIEPWGIFLRKVPGTTEKSKDSNYLKLMADAYSHLGFYVGLAGDFTPWETFRSGIAVSRSIFTGNDPTTGTTYSPFYASSNGTANSLWNSTQLFGVSLPFRFGGENDLKLNGDFYGLTSHLEYYSDPSFNTDFYTRSEGFDWGAMLSQSTAAALTQKTSFTWDLNGRLSLPASVKIPLIQSLSLQYFNVKLSWLSKLTSPAPVAPASSDPGRYFFYPVLLTAPSASLAISGELLRFSTSTRETAASRGKDASPPVPAFPGKGLRPPADMPQTMETGGTDRKTPAGSNGPKEAVAGPAVKKNLDVPSEEAASSVALSYQVQPTTVVENTYDNAAWANQAKVDFKALYTTADITATSSLKTAVSLMGGILDTTANLALDGTARARFNRSETVTDATWNSLLLRDIAQNKYDLKTVMAATLRPLKYVPGWDSSNLSYNLIWRLYRWQRDANLLATSFTGTGPVWDANTVTAHSLQSTWQTKIFDNTETLSLSAQLPPISPILYTGTLDLSAWLFSTRVQTSLKSLNNVWTWQPLVASETLKLTNDVTFTEELQFNLDNQTLSKSTSSMKLWGASVQLLVKTMKPTDPLGNTKPGSVEALLPSNLSVTYDLATAPLYFWKDRIRLQPTVKAGWSINPTAYTDNSFTFSTTTTLSIFRFLDLSFSSYSTNTKTYRYFPGLAENPAVNEQWVNPIVDLAKSFNFFSEADRKSSAFKIRSLAINAVHYLHDWNLSLSYQGVWETHTVRNSTLNRDVKEYYWAPTFSIKLQWVPVPEIKSTITGDYTGIKLRG